MRVVDTTITVPGLTRPVTVVQVTDLHLLQVDDRDPQAVQAVWKDGRWWAPYSVEILQSFILWLRQEQPDAVVYTGDIAGLPSAKNLDTLRDLLANGHPPYLYIPGNHELDWGTGEFASPEVYDFALQEDPAVQTLELAGIRLVGIDNSNNNISPAQLTTLQGLFADQTPTLLFAHVPLYLPTLYQEGMDGFDLMGGPVEQGFVAANEATRTFMELVTGGKTPIQAIFAGHIHAYNRSDKFFGNNKQYVTPMATQTDGRGVVRRIHLLPEA